MKPDVWTKVEYILSRIDRKPDSAQQPLQPNKVGHIPGFVWIQYRYKYRRFEVNIFPLIGP